MARFSEWLQAVRSDGWRNMLCGFCHKRPTMADDCGLWFLTPDGNGTRPCCRACYESEPGRQHRARHGVGER